MLSAWGPCEESCSADIDGSGEIDALDLAQVLNALGFTCPRITGVSPVSGPPSGGNVVTITGTHLGGVTEVRIGEQPARKVAVVDDHAVTAVVPASTPAGATGARLLTVTTDGGTDGLADGYTYVLLGGGPPPSISSVSPQTVPTPGNVDVRTVSITGANFSGATRVTFDGIPVIPPVISSVLIRATAPPPASGGMFDVAVTPLRVPLTWGARHRCSTAATTMKTPSTP